MTSAQFTEMELINYWRVSKRTKLLLRTRPDCVSVRTAQADLATIADMTEWGRLRRACLSTRFAQPAAAAGVA